MYTQIAFYEEEWNLGRLVGENTHRFMIYVERHFDSIFKVCICWTVYVTNIKMFGPESMELYC